MATRRVRLGVAAAVLVLVLFGIGLQVVATPPNAVVMGMLAVRLHGTAVQVGYPNRLDQVLRREVRARIEDPGRYGKSLSGAPSAS